jgi:hypothetical protein
MGSTLEDFHLLVELVNWVGLPMGKPGWNYMILPYQEPTFAL